MGFSGLFDRHNIQYKYPLGPDILVDGIGLIHHKYMLIPEDRSRGRLSGMLMA